MTRRKIQIIEIKAVNPSRCDQSQENAGGKYEGKFHYVIENTCRKNVRNGPLHYVIEK
jgi:hypothetical protein